MADRNPSWKSPVVYWELRRLLFSVLVVPVTLAIYYARVSISAGVGDSRYLNDWQVACLFALALFVANTLYSTVYLVEAALRKSRDDSVPPKVIRPIALVAGCVIGVCLSPTVARNIAGLEYSPTWISNEPEK